MRHPLQGSTAGYMRTLTLQQLLSVYTKTIIAKMDEIINTLGALREIDLHLPPLRLNVPTLVIPESRLGACTRRSR